MRVLGFLFICIVAANADHCSPGLVPNITLNSTYYLKWTRALNPNNCTISGYVVNVFDLEDGTERQFQTHADTLIYDFYFLDMCETYIFEVHALTEDFILGPSTRVNATTAPSDVDLQLVLNNATTNNSQLDVSWHMSDSSALKCISYYRVVYWDENNLPVDSYVPSRNFSLPNLVPCMKYTFRVSAIITNPDWEGPISEFFASGEAIVPSPPKLVNITASSKEVNMFWKVPSYDEHRCQLTSLVVYTTGAPNNKTEVTIPLQDSPLRPDVQVTIDGLSSNNVYVSNVALENIGGSSKNVTVTYQTSDNFRGIDVENVFFSF